MTKTSKTRPQRAGRSDTAELPRIFENMPEGLDLRDEAQQESLLSTADALLDRVGSLQQIEDLEAMLAQDPEAWPLAARVAAKLARSKGLLADRAAPLHLSVVLPLYAEHERMLLPSEHPVGEGFLDRKLRELGWLFEARPHHAYELLVVDDGCPHESGRRAEEILHLRHPDAPARVSYLADAIEQRLPIAEPLRSVDESRKAGSIHYGMWQATRAPHPGHVVLYTDADLSTNLGQSGLLIDALDRPGIRAAAGSRRDKLSVTVKSRGRSARGRLFIYLWKQMLPELGYIDDTQCGFKAFPGAVVREIVEAPQERGFAFDIELLLRCELSAPRSIARVPIAWVDSEAASTTVGLDPYLAMLQSVVMIARHYCGKREKSEPFAQAIEALDDASWHRAIEELGPKLEPIDPSLDATQAHLPASELLAATA